MHHTIHAMNSPATKKKTLVVISFYDRHPVNNLIGLIRSFNQHSAGEDYDVCIIVNKTKNSEISLPKEFSRIPVEYRYNLGMNIGAWDHGWRIRPGYPYYLFLQDECYVIRDNWLSGYREVLVDPSVGMVGESLNTGWDRPWSELRKTFENFPMSGHFINGEPANRVDCYLHFLSEHGVEPRETGRHLRSLIWFYPAAVLNCLDGFLIGRDYGECIAAEIAASKKVESLGLRITQAKPEEFFYIRHIEYNQDRPGGPYTHDQKYVSYDSVRWLFESSDKEWRHLVRTKFQKYFRLRQIRFSK
jgi:hypothetical protein